MLTWRKEALQRLFFRLPSLAVGWYSVVSTDLVNRLQAARASAQTTAYRHILLGVLSDGTVSPAQKEMLRAYRAQHGIPQEFHVRTLTDMGWASSDWERGSTQKGWLESLFKPNNQTPQVQ